MAIHPATRSQPESANQQEPATAGGPVDPTVNRRHAIVNNQKATTSGQQLGTSGSGLALPIQVDKFSLLDTANQASGSTPAVVSNNFSRAKRQSINVEDSDLTL